MRSTGEVKGEERGELVGTPRLIGFLSCSSLCHQHLQRFLITASAQCMPVM